MGFFDFLNPENRETPFFANHIHGLEINKNDYCKIAIKKDKLMIFKSSFKDTLIKTFDLADVKDIETKQEIIPDEVTQKDKSVIGRAVVGGILLGPLGAVVGGMSGIGTKTEVKKGSRETYILITMTDEEQLLFKRKEGAGTDLLWSEFISRFRKQERLRKEKLDNPS